MTRLANTLLVVVSGLLIVVSSSAEQQTKEPLDLYKLDGVDDDTILAMSDLDMFSSMHFADHADDDQLPDFSRVDVDDDDDDDDDDNNNNNYEHETKVSSSDEEQLKPTEPNEIKSDISPNQLNVDDHDEDHEWQEPRNKMDLVRFFNGLYYQKQYSKINGYLVDRVNTANVEDNMVEINAWLEREQRAGKNMFLNQATIEALEQFYNLTQVTKDNVGCSRHAYSILWKNDRATEGKAHTPPSKLSPPRRIEAIVHQVYLRHAIQCLYVYPKKYAQLRASMDPKARELVESVLDNVLGNVDCVTSKLRSLADQKRKVARHVLESIERHSHEDPDRIYLGKVVDERRGRLIVQADKVGQLVERYLIKPCKYYVRTLGPDVFIPARFDALSLELEDRHRATSREIVEFLHGWIHYRLCDSLIKRDIKKLNKAVVRLLEKESS